MPEHQDLGVRSKNNPDCPQYGLAGKIVFHSYVDLKLVMPKT